MKIMKRTKRGFFGAFTANFSGDAMSSAHASREVQHSDAGWRRRLSSEQFRVLRRGATEPPFASPLLNERRDGLFECAGCGLALFSSAAKFDSGTGWPSFFMPMDGAVSTHVDTDLGMPRIEVHCRRCGGHLGHVFDDGPKPTGLRYCLNGAALKFQQTDA
ncbi:peptide-methionine (R)-S-oxide reductase MsrB [Caballeronia sp. BR00000012568055]|uniref:peptide-methionine (R)-S-oxide reductase MsrB n=1 Tax=Caballeronia sp. BR00000012568055 TaxID=2918761 RepID=UPI0023F82518|nr:peptide-methionine (R)-S-oxide reductase MsrB [Caballeronia sp. BR00000012568055]